MTFEHRRVTVSDGIVRKTYAANVHAEFEKARKLWEISQSAGFVAPQPLALDADRSAIDYEFIEGMVSLREPYLAHARASGDGQLASRIFREAGRVLAEIHSQLVLQTQTPWRPSPTFSAALAKLGLTELPGLFESCLHGDYGFSNVHYLPARDNRIAIIDCSSDNFTNFASDTIGPSYLDLAHMTACIDGLVPIHNHIFLNWKRAYELKEEFLGAYERRRGLQVDREWIARFAYANVVAKFEKELSPRWLSRLAVKVVFNSAKNNLPKRIAPNGR
jgi:hypothetical protein